MCGIFGVFAKSTSQYDSNILSPTLKRLAVLSESRGKESSGFSFWNEHQKEIQVLRAPVAVSEMLQEQEFSNVLSQNLLENGTVLNGQDNEPSTHPFAVIGHSRLVTNGTQLDDHNNQPVIKGGVVGVHNGIIVNVDQLWEKYPELERTSEVDTEVMLSIFRHYLEKSNSLKAAASKTFQDVFGTVATAMVFEDLHKALITTNNGSLYILTNDEDILIFASEKYILKKLSEEKSLPKKLGYYRITQVEANTGIVIDLDNFTQDLFEISYNGVKFEPSDALLDDKFKINLEAIKKNGNGNGNGKQKVLDSLIDLDGIAANPRAAEERKMLEFNIDQVKQLKRCTKCLLPETFPFIAFDEKGVCNICKNYVKRNQPKPIENLINLVEPYKRVNGEADCIVPYSGGRDSTYVLHYVKKELGLNPIALTYDWGMVTDLARRNIARVCSRLGVENIIVSADIRMKRDNIRKNISAWLKNPDLGMIPLFMAGDKYFFYYTKQIKKQTGIDLNIWGINYLENTDFKVGFAGLAPQYNKKRIYSLSFLNQVKLFSFAGKNLLRSPGYINSSIFDTLGSFFVRYLFPKKDYYHLFDYMVWDEKTIEQTILNEYEWETAIDTDSTWRIGDGTASFYNYIYFNVAGFSENETFRSNQIREGMITRDEGLKLIEKENEPRYETIKWYLDIIGMDYESTIKMINNIPKLYGN